MAYIVSHFVLSDMLLSQREQSGGWRSDKDLVLTQEWMTSLGLLHKMRGGNKELICIWKHVRECSLSICDGKNLVSSTKLYCIWSITHWRNSHVEKLLQVSHSVHQLFSTDFFPSIEQHICMLEKQFEQQNLFIIKCLHLFLVCHFIVFSVIPELQLEMKFEGSGVKET